MLLCGVLFCAMCFGLTGAIAGLVGDKTITVTYSDIKLIIDGKSVTPKDATGKTVEPFIFEGTTYLPVRAVAEALGKEVAWDGNTNTVIIGANVETDTDKQPVMLHNLKELRQERVFTAPIKIMDNYDNTYNGFIRPRSTGLQDVKFIEYRLEGNYSKLKGRLILEDRSRSMKTEATYQFIVDGKTILTLEALQPGDKPYDFEVDLGKGNLLRIEATSTGMDWGTNAFVNMVLEP